MTSKVLARKYRPTGFDAMVGQGHVVQALSNALANKRLHHAYLFTGTRGVGKTTVSRILAKALNCVGESGEGDITPSPCGHCQPCRDIDSGRFVDYVELDAASNRGVEEISQLLEQAVYKPVVGRFKVYMIDEVHMLSNTAFNAMLKTLEEPPDYLKFVLATTDPQKVPVTVLSRCLQFNLRPMPAQTVQDHLVQVLGQEAIAFEPDALRLLARAARGSMRDALSLTDQAIAFGAGALQEETVRQMLGSVDRVHVQRIVSALAARDAAALVETSDGLRLLGLSAGGTLEDLAVALQRMAVYQAVPGAQVPDDPDERLWFDLSGQLAADETQLYYSLCLQARAELALAPDEYGGLTMALLRCLAFAPGARGSSPPKAPGLAEPTTASVRPATVVSAAPALARAPVPPAGASLGAQPVASPLAAVSASTAAVHESPLPGAAQPSARTPANAPADAPMAVKAAAAPTSLSTAIAPKPPADAPMRKPVAAAPSGNEPPPWAEMDIPDDGGSAASPSVGPDEYSEAWGEPAAPRAAPSPAAPAPVAAAAAPSAPETALDLTWHQQVQEMCQQGLVAALVRELAMQAQCLSHEAPATAGGAGHWHLQAERESLCTDSNRERLQNALASLVQGSAQLTLTRGKASNTPAQREAAIREARQQAAQQLIEGDGLVQELLAQFPGAQILAGSVRPL
jgi:DNA polymerase-3 subunit gamma/tau